MEISRAVLTRPRYTSSGHGTVPRAANAAHSTARKYSNVYVQPPAGTTRARKANWNDSRPPSGADARLAEVAATIRQVIRL